MKKIGLLILALVVALGGLGAGYAMWSDEINITGDVDTGTVCFEFLDDFVIKDPCNPSTLDYNSDPDMNGESRQQVNKDVGCTSAVRVDPHKVEVTLDNVYPFYFTTISTHTENCGTIPIRLQQCTITYPDPVNPDNTITVPLADGALVSIPGLTQYGTIDYVYNIKWVNGTGAQLHEGDEHEDSFHVTVLQAANQGSQYKFTISRTAVQWNEYAPPATPQ